MPKTAESTSESDFLSHEKGLLEEVPEGDAGPEPADDDSEQDRAPAAEPDTEDRSSEPEESESPAEPEENESWIDDELTKRAESFGFSRDDLAELGSKDAAEKVISAYARKLSDLGRPAAPSDAYRKEPAEPKEKEPQATEFKIKLNADYTDPEVVRQFQDLHSYQESQLTQLRSQVGEMQRLLNAYASQAFDEQFDRWLEELGPDYEGLFGKGRGHELDPEKDEFKNRVKVREMMQTIYSGFLASKPKDRPPVGHPLFLQAVYSALGKEMTETTKRKVADRTRANVRRRHTSPPGRSPGNGDLSADERALRVIRDFTQNNQSAPDEF